MANITSQEIKVLREKSGAGIMDCKKALQENNGDIEASISWLRKKGIAGASKKSSRIASEGLVGFKKSDNLCCIIEVNSETDFVSKNSDFQKFINELLEIAVKKRFTLDELLSTSYDNKTNIDDALKNLISKIGENIVIRRIKYLINNENKNIFGNYLHNKVDDNLGKIACIVSVTANMKNDKTADLAKKIAMHIAASRPLSIEQDGIDSALIEKEKEIFKSQLIEEGKPENIIEKIVIGKVNKFLSEVTLLKQNWVMDPNKKVEDVINSFNKENNENFNINEFCLFVLGEGIETKENNFKEEVASQVKDNS